MNAAELVIGQLAFFSFREGRRLAPECRPAYVGIAHVFRNRIESGWASGDWMKLLSDAPVHSANLVQDIDFRSHVDIWDANFRWLYGQCVEIYNGTLKDDVTVAADIRKIGMKGVPQKALFYGNLQAPIRAWFMENIVQRRDEHPRTADAGTVTFFA